MASDRDVAVAFASAWGRRVGRPLTGWEVTAATGVRGLRLVNESGTFARFLLTEASDEAVAVLRANAVRWPMIAVEQRDAREPRSDGPFDYVDIDPYGSPVPFVAAAFAALRPGGVLAATATDLMVLAGVQPGACERKYGARPIRGRLGPEGGLRILLAYLSGEARTRGLAARPLLSYVGEHHLRVFVHVVGGSEREARDPTGEIDPRGWSGPSVGDRGPYGPLWLGPLFDPELVGSLRVPSTSAAPDETGRLFSTWREEVRADVPFYFEANRLASALALSMPPSIAALLEELRRAGYRAARTHARPEGFRTDAPRPVVESVARTLAREP